MADEKENQETPQKKRGRPRGSKNKNSSKAPSLSADTPSKDPQPEKVKDTLDILLSYLDGVDIENTLQKQEELQHKLNQTYFKDFEEINKSLKYCESVLGETLEDFVVIGHTYAGERIKIFKANSPKDMDSLKEAAKQFIIPFVMGSQGQQENPEI